MAAIKQAKGRGGHRRTLFCRTISKGSLFEPLEHRRLLSGAGDDCPGFHETYGSAIGFAEERLEATLGALTPQEFFNFTDSATGEWGTVNGGNWAAGFTPGMAWSLLEITGGAAWAQLGEPHSETLAAWPALNEDVGYRMMPGVLPYYEWLEEGGRLAEAQNVFERMLESVYAKELRWNDTVGAYETTWRDSDSGDPRANYGVLIDQTFDLTLLWWAAEQLETQDAAYADHLRGRVLQHAETVADHLVRADGSTFQWGYFDEADGSFISGETYQGYADDSTWARGQAWAMLSFAELALVTGDLQLTQTAGEVADWFLENLPDDHIPYWDFDAPDIPDSYRDSSAAAIAASALVRLGELDSSQLIAAGLSPEKPEEWRGGAEAILGTLMSAEYLAETGPEQSLLRHGAGNVPNTGVADNGLPYGDYFFLDALAGLQDWYCGSGVTVVVDFEELAVGPVGDPSTGIYDDPSGFRFTLRSAVGGSPGKPSQIYGSAQGYPSKVLHPADWAQQYVITRADGAPFDLASFDFAASRYGDSGDFVLTGTFEGGEVRQQTVAFTSSKTPQTLTLDWTGLTGVRIAFAGGVNNAYGALDNFVFNEEEPPAETVVVDYEEAALGPIASGTYSENGFVFFNRPGAGGTSLEPLIVHGPAQGYASQVLSTTNWARRIDIQKEDGGTFDLSSFDYAAGRWGEAGDFVLTGYFAAGGTDSRTIPFSSKQLTTLELGWEDLELVSVNFAGGVNSAYGAVDNFVFGSDGQEDQPPTTTGSLNDPDPVAGPVRIQFDGRNWNEVHGLLPLADGSFFVIGASGVEPADPAGETAPVTRQDPTEVMHYITRHLSDGSIDTSWRQDGRDAVPAELQPLIGLKLFGVPEQYVQPLGDGMLVRPAGGDLMRFDDQLNRDMSFGDGGAVPGGQFTTIPGAGFAVLSSGVVRVYDAGGNELRSGNVNDQILPLLFDGSEVQVRRIGDLGADAAGNLYVGVTNIATGFDHQNPDQVPFSGAARFLPTLQLDTSYGRQGISRESVSDLEDETHRSLFVNDDGRVLLGINENDGDRNVIFFDPAGADGTWVRYGAISEVWGAVFLEDGEVAFVVQEQEPEFNALVRDAYGFRVVLATPAGNFQEIARFDDNEIPRQLSGAFTASDGTFVLGGFQEDLELNGSGFPVDIDHQATLWRVAVPTEQLITVDFESAAVGQIASGLYTEDGFTFSNRPGSGGTSLEPLIVHGPAQGYASKVLSITNWARRIDVVRDGGGSFDLSSFDYAAGRWGEAGDFLLTGYFTNGSTQAQSVAFSSKSLSTLDLDWQGLDRISINFAGGVNSAYGSVDNFQFVV